MDIETFVRKPLSPEQVGSWADLCMAILEADENDDIFGEEDLAEEFADPLADFDRGSIAVYDGDVMVAYNMVQSASSADSAHNMRQSGGVRREYRGRGLGSELLDWSQRVAPVLHAERFPGQPLTLGGACLATNTSAMTLFADQGYRQTRWFHQMTRDLSADVGAPALTDCVEIAEFSDARSADALFIRNEAFRDHFDPSDTTPEGWAFHLSARAFRPEYSFVAYLHGEPIGLILAHEYEAYNKAKGLRDLYIPQVGTRRAGRKRGIASALLATALAAAKTDGFDTATLDVDADSPTGALALYERAGFVVGHTSVVHRKELRP